MKPETIFFLVAIFYLLMRVQQLEKQIKGIHERFMDERKLWQK